MLLKMNLKKFKYPCYILLALLFICPTTGLADDVVTHEFTIELAPNESRIQVNDSITVPEKLRGKTISFILHGDLHIAASSVKVEPVAISEPFKSASQNYQVPIQKYQLKLPPKQNQFNVQYDGRINHPITQPGEEYERAMRETPGLIDAQGVFLADSTVWYPVIDDNLVTFSMTVSVPKNWSVVSQGKRTMQRQEKQKNQISWEERHPQDAIYLVANQYHEYSRTSGDVVAMVFLREQDDALAQKYLETTHQYISMYDRLLGPYLYGKFALVENFWETGYGMPSFTLLGPKVLRFPFILHSSYPHEILHNWWGNGVYVNYESGNWAEGLTAYLADHLIKEQRGEGADYRRSVLQKYTDFVTSGRDFALTEFRSRHSASTEAVGYGKTMIFFHMLRMQLGDGDFVRSLRELYQDQKFKPAAFADVQMAFEKITNKSLSGEFTQWVNRVGAPSLRIKTATSMKANGKYQIKLELEQQQSGKPYSLNVPVAVHRQGIEQAYETTLHMNDKQQSFEFTVEGRPLRVDVDSQFDVFRRLHAREIPAALSQGFGAENILILIPSAAPKAQKDAYLKLAQAWQKSQEGTWQIKTDKEVQGLPKDRTIWILGWENRFRPLMEKQLQANNISIKNNEVRFNDQQFFRQKHSLLFTARHPKNETQTLLWLAADNSTAVPGLTRKLPHYRKYSYLAFEGDEPENVAKGQWEVTNSPMSHWFQEDGKPISTTITSYLATRHALAELPPVFSSERMMQDIAFLASESMAGRELGSKQLNQAAEYIAQAFKQAGLKPGGDEGESYFQRWQNDFGGEKGNLPLRNVVGIIPGNDPAYAKESVIVSAHYDHLGKGWPDVHKGDEGKIHYGADDNASGVAVMLELARQIADQWKPDRAIIFIAFTGEEAQRVGSRYYVKNALRYPAKKAIGVINLDTVGRLGDKPVTVFGVGSAREWIHIFRGIGFVTGIKINSVSNDYGFSDQKSFIDAGVPGVQLFGSVHQDYHRPGDTIDKIDADGLVKVATVLKEAVEYLANREEPMHASIESSASYEQQKSAKPGSVKPESTNPQSAKPQPGRNVSLGTVPDFEFQGKGVRITGTVAGSPAQKAGLQEGDILIFIKDANLENLNDFARVLRGMKPGEKTTVKYKRDGKIFSIDVTVEAR